MTIVDHEFSNPMPRHRTAPIRPLGFLHALILYSVLVLGAVPGSAVAAEPVASTGPTKQTRDAIIERARNSVYGRWQAPAAGGWRYQRYTAGRWYTGEAYTQHNPQESWELFIARMSAGQGAPGTDQGNDCSGFVSYAWGVPRLTTATIQYSPLAKRLSSLAKLRRGDVLVRRKDGAGHIAIFDRRLPGGEFLVYEQTPPAARHKVWKWSYAKARGYVAMRRVGIVEDSVRPTGRITAPAKLSQRFIGDPLAISGRFADDRSVSEVDFYVGVDTSPGVGTTADAWKLIGTDSRRGDGGYGLRWSIDAPEGSDIWLRTVPVDISGNRGTTVDVKGPIRVAYRPSISLAIGGEMTSDLTLSSSKHVFTRRISNSGNKAAVLQDIRGELLAPGQGMVSRVVAEGVRGTWDSRRSKDMVGDFDGDGDQDLLSLYDMDDADTAAYIRFSSSADEAPTLVWRSGPGGLDLPASRLTVGDFDRDGVDDVAVIMPRAAGGVEIRVLRPLAKTMIFQSWRYLGSSIEWSPVSIAPIAADVDGDGDSDLVLSRSSVDKRTTLLVFKAWGRKAFAAPRAWWASSPGAWNPSRVVYGPDRTGVSGDGLVAAYRKPGGGVRVFSFAANGDRFDRSVRYDAPASLLPATSKPNALIGDYDGDGIPDVAVARLRTDGGAALFLLTPVGKSVQLTELWTKASRSTYLHKNFRFLPADVNGDGRTDIAGLYDAGFSRQRYIQLVAGKISVFTGTGPQAIPPGGSVTYSRSYKPVSKGTYLFRVSYKLSDGVWRVAGEGSGAPGVSSVVVR